MGTFNVLNVPLNGQEHFVYEWLPEHSPRASVVLVHGYMDAAGSWDLVALALARAGYRVLAPNLRGFGIAHWSPPGSYYHFPDYVLDVASFLATFDEPPHLVGHSMGGTVAGLVAGAFPKSLRTLSLLEGLGPPNTKFEDAPERTTRFVEDMTKLSARRSHRALATEDEALDRLQFTHRAIPREILKTRLVYLVKETERGFVWRFDPLHRTRSAMPFFAQSFVAHLRLVEVDTLLVSGGPRGFHPEDEEERASALARKTSVELALAGHMMHWTYPEELALHLSRFFEGKRDA